MKIYSTISRVLLPLLSAGMLGGCTKGFEEINRNPNTMNVGDLNAYGVFEAMFYGYAKKHTRNCYNYSNELVQFTASTSTNSNYHRYSFNDTNLNDIWSGYAQYAANADHMIQQGEKFNEPAAIAVGKTLKALFMANVMEIFGDIPFDDAFKGNMGVTTPVFESQEEVYRKLFQLLEEANDLYSDRPTFAKPSIDLMYGGDMQKWRKFNNSIYMRLLMRVSGRPEMGSAAKLQEMLDNSTRYPVISSNSESATIKNTGLAPYYGAYRPSELTKTTFRAHHITYMFIDMCLITGAQTEVDPRLYTMCSPSNGEWMGVPGGASVSEMRGEREEAGSLNYEVFVRDAAPYWLFDYSEVQFILAEAALKGYIQGGEPAARTYYENAVKASCQKWGELNIYSSDTYEINDARLNAFLKGNIAGWDNHEDKMRLIAEQKFISLLWIGFEAYNELRRTGYPVIPIGSGCSYNNFEFPQRLPYPTNTVGSNSANVNAALSRMGGENTMRTPLWWSYKAINGTFTAVRASSSN